MTHVDSKNNRPSYDRTLDYRLHRSQATSCRTTGLVTPPLKSHSPLDTGSYIYQVLDILNGWGNNLCPRFLKPTVSAQEPPSNEIVIYISPKSTEMNLCRSTPTRQLRQRRSFSRRSGNTTTYRNAQDHKAHRKYNISGLFQDKFKARLRLTRKSAGGAIHISNNYDITFKDRPHTRINFVKFLY